MVVETGITTTRIPPRTLARIRTTIIASRTTISSRIISNSRATVVDSIIKRETTGTGEDVVAGSRVAGIIATTGSIATIRNINCIYI